MRSDVVVYFVITKDRRRYFVNIYVYINHYEPLSKLRNEISDGCKLREKGKPYQQNYVYLYRPHKKIRRIIKNKSKSFIFIQISVILRFLFYMYDFKHHESNDCCLISIRSVHLR